MPEFSLRDAHKGRVAVVLGGAESLPSEFWRCPWDAVRISANEHGCKFTRCDYIVALDDLTEKLQPYGVPRIGPYLTYEHPYLDKWTVANSAAFGCYVALVMGCSRVIVTGVDCYRSGYWHHETAPKVAGKELFRFLEWQELKKLVPDGFVRAAGGPLVELFGGLDGD